MSDGHGALFLPGNPVVLYHVFTTFLLENRTFYKLSTNFLQLSTTFGSRRVFTPKVVSRTRNGTTEKDFVSVLAIMIANNTYITKLKYLKNLLFSTILIL